MLYQELPRIDSTPLDGWGRWLIPTLAGAAGLTAAAILLLVGHFALAGIALLCGIGAAALAFRRPDNAEASSESLVGGPDYSLVGAALGLSRDPVALTDGEGTMLVVNAAYRERFGGAAPLQLAANDEAREGLKLAQSMAWRDSAGCVAGVETSAGSSRVEVDRVGAQGDLLLWRFPSAPALDPLSAAVRRIGGAIGERLGSAGVLAAVVDARGEIVAANRLFADRALEGGQSLQKTSFTDLVEIGEGEQMRLIVDGESGHPMHAVHVPEDSNGEGSAGTFLLFDSAGTGSLKLKPV